MADPAQEITKPEAGDIKRGALPPISSWVFDKDQSDGCLGAGLDSVVFRKGDKVYKVYHAGFPLESLLFYQKITNQAADLLEKTPRIIYVGPNLQGRIEIIRIDDIGQDKTGSFVTSSRFVPGPFWVGWSNFLAKSWGEFDGLKSDRGVEILRLFKRNSSFRSPNPWNPSEVDFNFLKYLEDALRVKGIYYDRTNIKIGVDEEAGYIRFLYTDLCATVTALHAIHGPDMEKAY